MQYDADWARRAQRELRSLLNEWDPIGVSDPADGNDGLGPIDEYDCIGDPLLSRLLRGDNRHEIAKFLRGELADHFGLEPTLVATSISDRIFEWWESFE